MNIHCSACDATPAIGIGWIDSAMTPDPDAARTQTVIIRFGKEPPVRDTWILNNTRSAVVIPSYAKIVQGMANAGSMRIQYEAKEIPWYASFETADLKAVLSAHAACSPLLAAWPAQRIDAPPRKLKGTQ